MKLAHHLPKLALALVCVASGVSIFAACQSDPENTAMTDTGPDTGGHATLTDGDSGTPSVDPGLPPPPPPVDGGYTLAITSPANGDVVALPQSGQLPVSVTSNLTFMKAMTCGSTPNCGHAHLLIDGTACNAPRTLPDGGTAKWPYNYAVQAPSADGRGLLSLPSTDRRTAHDLHRASPGQITLR